LQYDDIIACDKELGAKCAHQIRTGGIKMRLKRITALAASATLVVSSLAGCSKESSEETTSAAVAESTTVAPETTKAPETDAPTEKETEDATKAPEKETQEEDAKQTEPEETKPEETKPVDPDETEPEETKPEDPDTARVYFPEVNDDYVDSAKGFVDVIEALPIDFKDIKAESVNSFSVKIHSDEGTDEELKGKLIFALESDKNTNQFASLSADVSYNEMKIKGDICNLYKVDGDVYVDFTPVYSLVFSLLGEDMQKQVEPILKAFGVDANTIQSLLKVTIPVPEAVEEITVSKEMAEAAEDLEKLVIDDIVNALSYNDYVTKNDDSYCVKINQDNLAYLIMDVVAALDTNMDDIYNAGAKFVSTIDPIEIFDQAVAATKDSIVPIIAKYFITVPQTDENGKAVEMSNEDISKMLDEYIAEAREELVEMYDESKDMIDDPESKKQAFDAWSQAVDSLLSVSPEEATEVIKKSFEETDGGFDIDLDVKKTDKGFGIDVEGSLQSETATGNVTITFKSENTIGFGASAIKAPTGFTTFEDAMKVAEDLVSKYMALQEASKATQKSSSQK
jgi:hypothetical protein